MSIKGSQGALGTLILASIAWLAFMSVGHAEHGTNSFSSIRRLPPVELSPEPLVFFEQLSLTQPTLGNEDVVVRASVLFDIEDSSQDCLCEDGFSCDCLDDCEDPPAGFFLIPSTNTSIKLGGYVKADFIHDFDAIASEDNFNTTTIFTDGRDGENTRLHARQTRLNLDARWPTDAGPARIFIEGDFFGAGSSMRMRHAYGEIGRWLIGQTWTTATDIEALPSTLDFESPIAFIVLRRAMIRWTYDWTEQLDIAVAAEDPRVVFPLEDDLPNVSVFADAREPWPDIVGRIRYTTERWQLQCAGIVHTLGYQRPGEDIESETGYGFLFGGYRQFCQLHKFKFQAGFGSGVGALRGVPEGVPNNNDGLDLLDVFIATAGYEIQWNDLLTSTAVYSVGQVNNSPLQEGDAIHSANYFAINLVWNVSDRVYTGIEYLHGRRLDFDRDAGEANRVQLSFWFNLP